MLVLNCYTLIVGSLVLVTGLYACGGGSRAPTTTIDDDTDMTDGTDTGGHDRGDRNG